MDAPNIVFLSGEADPLKLCPNDRRFAVINVPVPAPASWQRLLPTDTPVLRNDLWHAERDVGAGTWAVSVLASHSQPRVVARQVYVVDDHGCLQPVPHPTVHQHPAPRTLPPAPPPALPPTRRPASSAVALALAMLLTACGGGDPEPDQPTPSINCALQPVVCQ